ncbi:unnamed protein product [Closterium sp. Yama58-4]|nr:unnamed protein product [Closterium sp. Yama58-4]
MLAGQGASEVTVWKEEAKAVVAGEKASEVTVWKEEAKAVVAGQKASELTVWKEEARAVMAGQKASEVTVWKEEARAAVVGQKASELTVWKEEAKTVVVGQKAFEVAVWKEEAKTAIIEQRALEEPQVAVIEQRGSGEHQPAVIKERPSEVIVWEEEAQALISRALGYSDTQHLLEHYTAVYEAMRGLKSEGNLGHSREKSMSFELTQNTQHLRRHYTAVDEAMQGLESWGHGGGEESVSFELTQNTQKLREHYTAVHEAMRGLESWGHGGREESVSFESIRDTQHLLEHHRAVDEAMRGLESEESWEHSREESMRFELTQNTEHVLQHQRTTVDALGWEGGEMVGNSGGESMEQQQPAAGTQFGPTQSNVEPLWSRTGAKPHSLQRTQSTPTSLSSSSAPAAHPAHSARSDSSAPSAATPAVRSEWHLRAAAMRAAAALARPATPATPTTPATSATPPFSSARAPDVTRASSVFESSKPKPEAPRVFTAGRQDAIRATIAGPGAGHVSAQQVEWLSVKEVDVRVGSQELGRYEEVARATSLHLSAKETLMEQQGKQGSHLYASHSEADAATHPAVAALLARWHQTQFASVCFEKRPELKLPSLIRDTGGAEAREGENLEQGLVMPLGSSTADVVVGGDAEAGGDAADRAAAEMAWLDTTLGSTDAAAEAPASHASGSAAAAAAAAAEEHVSWLETPLRSLARRSGGVLTPGQREKLEKAGMWTVRHLLEHYPHTYKDLTRSREDVLRDGQVAAVGVVESVSVNSARGGGCAVAELRIRCSPPDSPATTRNTDSPTTTTTSRPTFSITRSTSSSSSISSHSGGGGFMVTAKQFRAGSWAWKALQDAYPRGCLVSVTGQVRVVHGDGTIELDMNSDIVRVDARGSRKEGAVPVYSARKDMDPLSLRVILESLIKLIPPDMEYHSPSLRARYNLLPLPLALATIHCPRDRSLVPLARRRIVFDEFFFYQLRILLQSRRIKLGHLASAAAAAAGAASAGGGGGAIDWTRRDLTAEQWSPLTQEILSSLPYTLTAGQMQAAREIISDMNWPVPMSRLLQGDVGCGKTVVALLACMEAVAHGYQVAVMAPTQFLAQQHVARFEQLLQALPPARRPKVCLLTASVKRAKALRLDIKEGRVDIIIGTHALIARATAFHRLGLAIVDEQHRFGVKQRARLHEKGLDALLNIRQQQEASDSDTEDTNEFREDASSSSSPSSARPLLSEPHTLTMTATPIPRSLALVLHGQSDISRIAELPPGRTPVETLVFYDRDGKGGSSGEESEGEWEEDEGKERDAAYKILREEVQSGGRAFIVFPIIDASEELPEVRAATEEFQLLTEPGGLLGRALRHGSSAAARQKRAAAQKDRPRRRSDYSRYELCEIDNSPDGYDTDQYNCELDAMYGEDNDDYESDEDEEEEEEEEEDDDGDADGDDGGDGDGSEGAAVLRCGLVHGRMEPEEKEGVMRSFQEGSIQVLVCTTVIEVGIDIPEATVMLVEHAERYGLAQLHQLRGRVGRGQRPSRCLLVGSNKGARLKLKLLETSHDGMELAQMDLKMRGPGELMGSKQSGRLPGFNLARLDGDVDILNEAMQAAEEVVEASKAAGKMDPALAHELLIRNPSYASTH